MSFAVWFSDSDTAEDTDPIRKLTLSLFTSRRAFCTAVPGLAAESSISNCTGRRLTPPALFTASSAICAPRIWLPPSAA